MSRYTLHNDEDAAHTKVDVNDVHPYPTKSEAPPPQTLCQETMSVFQLLGFSIGSFASLATESGPDAPLSRRPWMVGFVVAVVIVAVEAAVISRRGIVCSTWMCNWRGSAEFRGAVVDLLIVMAGFIIGLGIDAATGSQIGGAIAGGAALGVLFAVIVGRWACNKFASKQ